MSEKSDSLVTMGNPKKLKIYIIKVSVEDKKHHSSEEVQ